MEEGGLLARFRIQGDDCPLATATREVDIRIDAWPELLRSDGYTLLQFTTTEQSDILGNQLDNDDRIRYLYIERGTQQYTFRCLSNHPCIQHRLFDIGFMPLSIRYEQGDELYQGAVIGQENLREMFNQAKEDVGVHLEGLQQIDASQSKRQKQQWDLTPSQNEALTTALEMNYFEVPRESSADDVANEIGISQSAFLQRLHRAEKSVFTQMFDF